MIKIKPAVYKTINEYTNYLVKEGLTSQKRADEKVDMILKAIYQNLGGLVTHRLSPYTKLGKDFGCRIFIYKDPKSRTQWGFAYKIDNETNDIVVYAMKNMYLVNEKKEIPYTERFKQMIDYIERNFDGKKVTTYNVIT